MNNKIFTLKQLASIFDISRRTMLYYEEIEILIPSYISKTGYRYYSENEYFRLKYIIRLRKLGFDLDNIKKIILIKENNILMPLLRKKKAELKSLMKTIDDFLEEGNFRMIHADECYYIEETQPYLD
jgi:DNA-binding transcriptional MerR regulator